jgi:hypothetical protein
MNNMLIININLFPDPVLRTKLEFLVLRRAAALVEQVIAA